MKKVVVIGGGTGTFTVLSGLKKLKNIDLTAIVSSADSGGSTGILRDKFGRLPVGDYRQCLVALSDQNNGRNILRDLFQYRFSKGGDGLEGHNFGNLFITALTEILESEEKAFEEASKILNIQGKVYPVTFDDIQMLAEYDDGSISYGEAMIDESKTKRRIKKIWVQPSAEVYDKSKEAIENANLLIFGPGDLYTSILANVIIGDCANIICNSKAKIAYIVNLTSKPGQTDNFTAADYVSEMEKYICKSIDWILINSTELDANAVKSYIKSGAIPVVDNLNGSRIIRDDLISNEILSQDPHDKVQRSLIRHDGDKIAKVIAQLIK